MMGHVSKPKLGEFEVGYLRGHGWFVTDPDGRRIEKYHSNRTAACAARGRLVKQQAQASKSTIRACMTCRASFLSEGAHNRMCPECRNSARADTSTYGITLAARKGRR